MSSLRLPWITRPLVPEEVYTDREEFLEYFYQTALKAATRRTMSTVLLGRRRMGKTEIFRRVVNRLFFEQDPNDPMAVVPVYYSFKDKVKDRWDFSKKYLENFIQYYLSFYAQQPKFIHNDITEHELLLLLERSKSSHPFPDSLDRLIYWYTLILEQRMTIPEESVVEIPRRISDVNESTIVMFLDEFQNTRLPLDGFSVVGYMQEAVESPTCPHFVTGSAVSILAREILGRGSLFGRFDSDPIEPLSEYWGATLAQRAAAYYGAELPEILTPLVTRRCGGNPFYITALIRQAAKQQKPLDSEETINTILAIDISSGFIWAELSEQVHGWIERINDQNITKWILYLSALEDEDKISLERIQQELEIREGHQVDLATIRDILIRLSRGDLVEYLELGNWFRKIDDPILLEFLKTWGRIEVEGQRAATVRNHLSQRYRRLKRQVHEYQGYMAEIFMSQVLLSLQDKRKQPLPGKWFNSPEDISMPFPIGYVNHRVRLSSGSDQEIDLLAAFSGDMWVCQSKWETTRKVGLSVLQVLLTQAEAVQTEFDPISLRIWLFAHQGLTQEATQLAQEKGILWSSRSQLDELLKHLGLRPLPDM